MEKKQKERITKMLDRLDQVLEDLLEAQFGIDDEDWNKAMNKIEDGFSGARAFIQRS